MPWWTLLVWMAGQGITATLEVGPAVELPVPGAVTDVEPGPWGLVVVQGDDALWVVDPADGTVVQEVPGAARDVALLDMDADGTADLVSCGGEGLSWRPWTWSLQDAEDLGEAPCLRVAPLHWGGAEALVALSEDSLLQVVGTDGTDQEGATIPASLEAPLLATVAGLAAVADPGGWQVFTFDGTLAAVSAGGEVGWLGADGAVVLWTVLEPPALVGLDGSEAPLEADPGRFAWGDLDGDGLADRVVTYPLRAQAEVEASALGDATLDLPGEAGLLALADLDGDGCDDILVAAADGSALWHLPVLGCGAELDLDGDGFTPVDGDCDDDDAQLHPQAFEACDGRDQDCDGEVDEVNDRLWFRLRVAYGTDTAFSDDLSCDEGQMVQVRARLDGCRTFDVAVDWSTEVEGPARCAEVAEERLQCVTTDDGRVALDAVARRVDDGTLVASGGLGIQVANVAPTMTWGCGAELPDQLSLEVGDVVEEQLQGWDPGDDLVTFSVRDAPPSLLLTPEGDLRWTVGQADVGTWATFLVAADEDGGARDYPLTLRVHADGGEPWRDDDDDTGAGWLDDCGPDPEALEGGCCCGTSGMSMALLGFAGLRRGRRRRG